MDEIKEITAVLRRSAPLVASITNDVAMNFTANALLAIGASPVMFHAADEAAAVASAASSLVLNIGTLDNAQLDAMSLAARVMNRRRCPVVFDPVGAGFTPYRDRACRRILTDNHIDIIKGNASEILALASRHCLDLPGAADIVTKGVDTTARAEAASDTAQMIAEKLSCVVVISGATDIITDGRRIESVAVSTEMMERVTAMGCTATALVAAYAAVMTDYVAAATAGMTAMSLAGQRAAERSAGPGSFLASFLDNLYTL